MYIHARIRKYVIRGADLPPPPPTLNRVNTIKMLTQYPRVEFDLET